MISPEQARDTARKYTGWALAGLAVILAPVIYTLALGFVEMLWAVALAGMSVGIIWMLAPAFLDFIGNKRLQLVKAEAAANPIETMQNIYMERSQELKLKEEAVIEMDTQVQNVGHQIKALERSDPEEAKSYLEILNKLEEGLDEMKGEYSFADKALATYLKQIDKAKRLWTVAQALNKALAVNASARAKVFSDIKNQVAFDAVNDNLSKAFARLNMAVEKHKSGNIGAEPQVQVVEGSVVTPLALPEPTPSFKSLSQVKASERVKVH